MVKPRYTYYFCLAKEMPFIGCVHPVKIRPLANATPQGEHRQDTSLMNLSSKPKTKPRNSGHGIVRICLIHKLTKAD